MRLISLARFAMAAAAATLAFPILADAPLLKVGSAAPPLSLKAADGDQHSLAPGSDTTILIFYRGLW